MYHQLASNSFVKLAHHVSEQRKPDFGLEDRPTDVSAILLVFKEMFICADDLLSFIILKASVLSHRYASLKAIYSLHETWNHKLTTRGDDQGLIWERESQKNMFTIFFRTSSEVNIYYLDNGKD